jgi:hypothetical protein
MSVPRAYRRIALTALTGQFRSASQIVATEWVDPGRGQVAIRNRYAGVNAVFDQNLCRNAVRYVDVVPPFDLGIEAVGEVVAVGDEVTELCVGDPVATTRLGSGYRDYQVAEAGRVYRVQAATPEVLALIPSGVSALVGLERIAQLQAGETIAIAAAAGGLGNLLVQLALRMGARVIGIAGSPAKLSLLRDLGCERTVDRRREDLREVLAREYPRGLDVAYDTVGGEVFETFVDHLAMHGRLVVSGHTSDFDQPEVPVPSVPVYRRLYWKSASIRAFQMPAFPQHFAEAANRLLAMHARGEIRPAIDPTPFAGLESVADAVEHLLAGRNVGKVVVRLA